jgi:hypothetical protein
MALPDHTRRLAEGLLERYCGELCRPDPGQRVELGFRLDDAGVTVFEKRRICGVPGSARAVDVARLRYAPGRGAWQLQYPASYAADGPTRWRVHPGLGQERSLARLLRALDEDPCGRFWPRLNGANLRFCSARGRCADCAERCRAVLGLS